MVLSVLDLLPVSSASRPAEVIRSAEVVALAAEAGELMEHFLWATPEASKAIAQDAVKRQKIADELADVVVYALEFANATGLDVAASIEAKMIANAEKYPVEKAKGRSEKYTEL